MFARGKTDPCTHFKGWCDATGTYLAISQGIRLRKEVAHQLIMVTDLLTCDTRKQQIQTTQLFVLETLRRDVF